ncbi:putative TOX high mobility group box protein [Heracleum sosnowskyi]|uniref:TOX high mobility group box protein n=1 Tax=Heracleum sosnowskyi TaxID=360622 RepID=A0AAD8H070_9APIA|nr:putative TOX high mobility group box protein [Heracleum sosnowskyi]
MEEMASLWQDQESLDDLKQKLFYTTFELNEEKRKSKDNAKQLMQLLKMTIQERDEARDQLNKLLNKLMPSAIPRTEILSTVPQISPENPLVKPTRANSSINESHNFSDQLCSFHSQSSSPAESFFDTLTSPDLSKINSHHIVDSTNNMTFMNQQPFVQDYNVPTGVLKVDQASLIIDNLVKDKTLPQKGNLLHAVLEAGQLLQTLHAAGPLPRWRNPPPLQSFHIPPPSIKVSDTKKVGVEACENSTHDPIPMNLQSYAGVSCGTSQKISTSVMNFRTGASSACARNGSFLTSTGNVNNFVAAKRQRFH